jgi:DUF4097 and DUF4098 domain-containing protein YvlB
MEISVSSKTMNNQTKQSKYQSVVAAVVLAALAMFAAGTQAQDNADRVTVKLSDPARPCILKASLLNGGITVKGYDGKDVIVEAHVRTRERERSEGNMKRLVMSSTGLTVEEDHNEVRVSTDSVQRTIDLTISVPSHSSLFLRTVNDGNVAVEGVEGELDVNDTNGHVTLSNVSGSAVVHALNGRILANFVRVNAQKSMAFSSLNGNIDLTFPADLKATLSLRTDNGEILSDFDVQLQSSAQQPTVEDGRANGGPYRVKFDKTLRGTINGGGQEIQIKNFNGSIYIRKAGASKPSD